MHLATPLQESPSVPSQCHVSHSSPCNSSLIVRPMVEERKGISEGEGGGGVIHFTLSKPRRLC